MAVGDRKLGGPGRIALLREIRDHGTITHAARAMKMSYKGAWNAIEGMNNLAGNRSSSMTFWVLCFDLLRGCRGRSALPSRNLIARF